MNYFILEQEENACITKYGLICIWRVNLKKDMI